MKEPRIDGWTWIKRVAERNGCQVVESDATMAFIKGDERSQKFTKASRDTVTGYRAAWTWLTEHNIHPESWKA